MDRTSVLDVCDPSASHSPDSVLPCEGHGCGQEQQQMGSGSRELALSESHSWEPQLIVLC